MNILEKLRNKIPEKSYFIENYLGEAHIAREHLPETISIDYENLERQKIRKEFYKDRTLESMIIKCRCYLKCERQLSRTIKRLEHKHKRLQFWDKVLDACSFLYSD